MPGKLEIVFLHLAVIFMEMHLCITGCTAGVNHIIFLFYGLHAFRRFAATQMIGSGIDVRTVSAVLGHSKPSTTLNIYSHEIDQLKTTAVDVIAGAIQNKKDQTKTKTVSNKKESTENSA